jgi:hypothetical protein
MSMSMSMSMSMPMPMFRGDTLQSAPPCGPAMLDLWLLVTGGLLGIKHGKPLVGPQELAAMGDANPVTAQCVAHGLLVKGPHGPVWNPWAFVLAVCNAKSHMEHKGTHGSAGVSRGRSQSRRGVLPSPACKLVQCATCKGVASLMAATEAGCVTTPMCPSAGCMSTDLHFTRMVAVDTPAQALAVASLMGLDRALERALAEHQTQRQQAATPVGVPGAVAVSCPGPGLESDEWEEAVVSTGAGAGTGAGTSTGL